MYIQGETVINLSYLILSYQTNLTYFNRNKVLPNVTFTYPLVKNVS